MSESERPPPPAEWPPKGWYPDPSGAPGVRWWDGTRWTESTSAPPFPQQGQGYPPTSFGANRVELSGWWRRAGAVILDNLILSIPLAVLEIPFGVFEYSNFGTTNQTVVHKPAFIAFALVAVVVNIVYSALMLSMKGQTLGMMATGIRLVDRATSQKAAWPQVRTRIIAFFLLTTLWTTIGSVVAVAGHGPSGMTPSSIPFTLVGGLMGLVTFLWPLGNPLKQTLHDKIASTVVIRT